jgi:hypothetical protein
MIKMGNHCMVDCGALQGHPWASRQIVCKQPSNVKEEVDVMRS